MTELQILEKAIKQSGQEYTMKLSGVPFDHYNAINSIIFSQKFARGLWGEGDICSDCAKPLSEKHTGLGRHIHTVIAWKHHIAKMAVAENRLEYLKQFLK